MNTLQEIVDEMKADFSRADKSYYAISGLEYVRYYKGGYATALEKYIPKLELLLSKGATEGGDKDGKADSIPMA